MAQLSKTHEEWSCNACTLLNKLENISCSLCGSFRAVSKDTVNDIDDAEQNLDGYGSIIYRIDAFTAEDISRCKSLYDQFTNNNAVSTVEPFPVILYGNNDMNYDREPSSDIALLSTSKCGGPFMEWMAEYDRTFCYGVVVQFHGNLLNYYRKIERLPIFSEFQQIIDSQFDFIQSHYLRNGHDIIIPSPSAETIRNDPDRFCSDSSTTSDRKQTVFHLLGTEKECLPKPYYELVYYMNFKEMLKIFENAEIL